MNFSSLNAYVFYSDWNIRQPISRFEKHSTMLRSQTTSSEKTERCRTDLWLCIRFRTCPGGCETCTGSIRWSAIDTCDTWRGSCSDAPRAALGMAPNRQWTVSDKRARIETGAGQAKNPYRLHADEDISLSALNLLNIIRFGARD
jgi:hypothetical protein